ncbi:MAG: hypothetical protein ACK55Z_24520, partial [bacterium]
ARQSHDLRGHVLQVDRPADLAAGGDLLKAVPHPAGELGHPDLGILAELGHRHLHLRQRPTPLKKLVTTQSHARLPASHQSAERARELDRHGARLHVFHLCPGLVAGHVAEGRPQRHRGAAVGPVHVHH